MDRAAAEAILDGDRETAIALLLRLDELLEANRRLEARVADLERQQKGRAGSVGCCPSSASTRSSSTGPSAVPRARARSRSTSAGTQRRRNATRSVSCP